MSTIVAVLIGIIVVCIPWGLAILLLNAVFHPVIWEQWLTVIAGSFGYVPGALFAVALFNGGGPDW